MKRIGFHAGAGVLVIVGNGSFPARSLMLSDVEGGRFQIWSLAGRAEQLVDWDEVATLDGGTFASHGAARAYLETEFAKAPATGDAYALAVPIDAPGQTTLPLQQPPSLLSSVRLEVNGVTYRAPEIAASDVAVTWLNPDFPLDPSDRVTVVYS